MKLSKGASLVMSRLEDKGFSAYAVGGCVRDFLMQKTPFDFDITTNARPDEIKSAFPDFTAFDAGIAHGTVAVMVDGEKIEITTFRQDGIYLDHRHPEKVEFTDELKKDLSRRDFTVNAMAYNERCGIVDEFSGRADIERRLIRTVGDPCRRFDEDALRILRALRFASTLDFDIDKRTRDAIFSMAHLLRAVSRERVAEELKKLLSGVGVERILVEYREVFAHLFERADFGAVAPLIKKADSTLEKLAVFFSVFSDFKTEISSLKLQKKDRETLISAITLSRKGLPTDDCAIRHLLAENGIDTVLLAYVVGNMPYGERITSLWENTVTLDTLLINGKDITERGIPAGKLVGDTLNTLLREVNSGAIKNDREALLSALFEKIRLLGDC